MAAVETVTRLRCGYRMLKAEGKKPPRHWHPCRHCAECREAQADQAAFWTSYERTMSS